VPADTWLHRLDPMTKLLMAAAGVALTFVLARIESGAVLLAIFFTVLGTGRVLRQAGSVFAGVGIIAATFLIVQGLVHPTNATPLIILGRSCFIKRACSSGCALRCGCTTSC